MPAPNELQSGTHLGYAWSVKYNWIGCRCGYVAIPPGHPWHGLDEKRLDADVHGGLTYARPDKHGANWVIGFDCAHIGDAMDVSLLPAKFRDSMRQYGGSQLSTQTANSVVRTTEFVARECRHLCEQAHAAVLAAKAEPAT